MYTYKICTYIYIYIYIHTYIHDRERERDCSLESEGSIDVASACLLRPVPALGLRHVRICAIVAYSLYVIVYSL